MWTWEGGARVSDSPLPGSQGMQSDCWIAPLCGLYVPLGQGNCEAKAVEAGQKWPAGHSFPTVEEVLAGQKNLQRGVGEEAS